MTTAGIQALTEKEKETLRLLVSGYDAKSMARHPGLSVHTVNERLRDARRKQSFKTLNTLETRARVARQVQGPLGALKARVLLSEEAVPAPPYGYQMVKFRTDYANKAGAIETLSLVREGGSWRVVGVMVE